MDSSLQIMIIDDEAIVGVRLKAALEKAGYAVTTFTDSVTAKNRLLKQKFDIIVTDLKMPHVDGMEILAIARRCWPDTKVIVITGFATVEVAKEAIKEGAFDFIVKPFKISQLQRIVDNAAQQLCA